jgi:hypothetical protein
MLELVEGNGVRIVQVRKLFKELVTVFAIDIDIDIHSSKPLLVRPRKWIQSPQTYRYLRQRMHVSARSPTRERGVHGGRGWLSVYKVDTTGEEVARDRIEANEIVRSDK